MHNFFLLHIKLKIKPYLEYTGIKVKFFRPQPTLPGPDAAIARNTRDYNPAAFYSASASYSPPVSYPSSYTSPVSYSPPVSYPTSYCNYTADHTRVLARESNNIKMNNFCCQ